MLRSLALALGLLLAWSPAKAELPDSIQHLAKAREQVVAQMMTGVQSGGAFTASGGNTFVGDVAGGTVKAWWGMRCYKASQASASQAIRLLRASDSTQQDIGFTAGCDLDTGSAATFCASTTCTIAKFYDLSGNSNDQAQSTAANQYSYTTSCTTHSKVCATTVNGQFYTTATNISTPSGISTIVAFAERTGSTSSQQFLIANNAGSNVGLGWGGSAVARLLSSGSALDISSTTDNAWHSFQGFINSASSSFVIDGTRNTGTTSNVFFNGVTVCLGGLSTGCTAISPNFVGKFTEGGIFDTATEMTVTQQNNINTSMTNYW